MSIKKLSGIYLVRKDDFNPDPHVYVISLDFINYDNFPMIVLERLTNGEFSIFQIDNLHDIDMNNQFTILATTNPNLHKLGFAKIPEDLLEYGNSDPNVIDRIWVSYVRGLNNGFKYDKLNLNPDKTIIWSKTER